MAVGVERIGNVNGAYKSDGDGGGRFGGNSCKLLIINSRSFHYFFADRLKQGRKDDR
jgi:hypothetical protein